MPTVLIIGDQPETLEIVTEFIENDYTVFRAVSVMQANNIIENESVDMILSDAFLTGENVIEFLNLVANNKPLIPITLISGKTMMTEAKKAQSFGVCQIIPKPFKLKVVSSCLRDMTKARETRIAESLKPAVTRTKTLSSRVKTFLGMNS